MNEIEQITVAVISMFTFVVGIALGHGLTKNWGLGEKIKPCT